MESLPTASSFDTEGSHARRMSLTEANSMHMSSSQSSGASNIPTSDSILTSPNYSYIFGFEKDFDHVEVKEKVAELWVPLCYYASALYLAVIFGGQAYMSTRPRFEMRRFLTAWNIMLAAFSIFGFARTLPEFLHVLFSIPRGMYHSVCSSSYVEVDRVSGFWSSLFVLSKVPELGDTIFIILRKQQLKFLHWYHHLTVLIYSWYSFSEYSGQARWFIVMNYLVHSMMYSYYALKAMRFRVPRGVAMFITSIQLIQMVVGCVVNYIAHAMKQDGLECHVSDRNIKLSFLMYTSYFVLFGHFFYHAYVVKSDDQGIKEKVRQDGVTIISANDTILKSSSGDDRNLKKPINDSLKRNGPKKSGDLDHGSDLHKKTSKYTCSKQDNLADNNESEGRQLRSRGEKQRQKVD